MELQNREPQKPPDEKVYIGTKIIKAFPVAINPKEDPEDETMGPGYVVIYDDGYRSFSPKEVFERCYRELTEREKRACK